MAAPPVARAALAAPAFLEISGLHKAFNGAPVVQGLDLAVAKGEFVTLLGPSGCGKTTTLRMIAGFIDIDGGAILIDGARLDQVPSHRRDTAMVFQNYALFPHLTVFENVAFGLRMRRLKADIIAQKVAEALTLVRLPQLGKRYPAELSGGQQQRIALARAVVLNPKLLLLDEPLSNLDAKLREDLRDELRDIHDAAGLTTILVTHDLEEAFAVSDRVAVMNGGKLEQFARPYDIFNRPASAFVADFVGHTNVIEGRVVREARGATGLLIDGHRIHATGDLPEGDLRFVVPAHALRVSRTRSQAGDSLAATLTRISFRGATVQFQARLGDRLLKGEVAVTPDTLGLAAGDGVFIGWEPGTIIPLPARSA